MGFEAALTFAPQAASYKRIVRHESGGAGSNPVAALIFQTSNFNLMNILVPAMSMTYWLLVGSFCLVSIILLVGMMMDAMSNAKDSDQ